MAASSIVACRWDWCRSTFSTIDALETHVKHDHIWSMQPMSRAEIALMRRLDLQGLHSSLDSGITSTDLILPTGAGTPPPAPAKPRQLSGSEEFDSFSQLSSPIRAQSPDKLPVSPSFESLMKQNGNAGLSAAVEMFERTRHLKTSRLSSHSRSPMRHPRSNSSSSSQAIDRQLTQEDDPSSQSFSTPELEVENGSTNSEGRLPADDDTDASASEEIRDPEPREPQQTRRVSGTPDPTRGQNFLYGPLSVPFGARPAMNPDDASQESTIMSQPLMSQANVSYPSQSQ